MSNHELSTRQMVELELIKKDVCLYFELIIQLQKQPLAGVLFPSLVPYLSLFAFESYNYFQRVFPEYTHDLPDNVLSIITSSRMRIKLFDDKKKQMEGTFDILNWITDFHNEWHVNRHKGVFAPLQRALQPDLGVFFCGEHIIGSTHTSLLNLGYSQGDLPSNSEDISPYIRRLSFSLGEAFGSYITKMIAFPEFSLQVSDFGHYSYNVKDSDIKYKDVKSDKFLELIFNGAISTPINLSLILFLSHINFLNYIFENLVSKNCYTIFKLKYIVLYHLKSSLEKMQTGNSSSKILTGESIRYIDAIILDHQLSYLLSSGSFRNILVHYGIGKSLDEHLSLETKFYGLTENFFDGKSYEEISSLIEAQIIRISSILEEWLSLKVRINELSNW